MSFNLIYICGMDCGRYAMPMLCYITFLSGGTGRAAVAVAGQPAAVLLGASLAQWQAWNVAARERTCVHMRCSIRL